MFSHVAYYLVIFGVPLMHNLIFSVKSQCTVQGCETGDSSISIAAEIRQMFSEFHERLQAIDRRSQEQDNASNQQMTNQHTSVMKRLDEVMELLLDHDICTKNQSQNLWTPTTGSTLRPETVTDSGNDPTLLQYSTLLPSSNNWTVIMNRFNGSLNFNRSWIEYKNGFGEIGRGEFWLGNEIVHRLTNKSGLTYSLRIEVQIDATGGWFYADYSTFSLDSEASKYAIHLSGYSGNAGDSMTNASVVPTNYHHNGMSFSTYDATYRGSNHCGNTFGGGWWFNSCYHSCLTCTYSDGDRFVWSFTGGWQTSGRLRAARMMIKSR